MLSTSVLFEMFKRNKYYRYNQFKKKVTFLVQVIEFITVALISHLYMIG